MSDVSDTIGQYRKLVGARGFEPPTARTPSKFSKFRDGSGRDTLNFKMDLGMRYFTSRDGLKQRIGVRLAKENWRSQFVTASKRNIIFGL